MKKKLEKLGIEAASHKMTIEPISEIKSDFISFQGCGLGDRDFQSTFRRCVSRRRMRQILFDDDVQEKNAKHFRV